MDHSRALRLIGLAGELRPNTAVYLANLGLALCRVGNLEHAIGRYRQALALDAGNAATHFKLGGALRDFESIEEDERAYSRAVPLEPAPVEAH